VIAFLRGQIVEINSEGAVVDVSGVGYDLQCPLSTLESLLLGEQSSFFVHTHVREDAIVLFGFATQLEKQVFLSLTKVNGVGPKLALKALSAGPVERLLELIEAGDVKGLSALPKIGKKTAEQIVLTLKGQLVFAQNGDGAHQNRSNGRLRGGSREDVVSALVNLGFRLQEVEKVVSDLPPELDLQEGIRQGLQALGRQF